ncbi:conserved hypothetical protein [Ricinus communis]|uniref:DUF7950 domain-containing protein n=1 Tax=Ricinus communis TaxID=3988 RepID=B9RAK1_RICCO|nr:conserved hypothetical protein [Ricinus communis]|eukprot:XP_002511226.1 uncharacterized protein LOC8266341 [Ricinus communis]
MDGRGGCCIARYGGGGGEGSAGYDMSTIDRIMLKFRPIAPKPANTFSSSPEIDEVGSRSSRGKRRCNKTNGNNTNNKRCKNGNNNRKKKVLSEEKVGTAVVTLPLLPETPDLLSPKQGKSGPTWLSFGSNNGNGTHHGTMLFGMSVDHQNVVTHPQIMRVVMGSCVTVECITDTWVNLDGLGGTDEEKRMNLERDTCPGFISDGFGRVTWTNEAYKKMAGQGEDWRRGEVVVWLVMKDKVTVMEAERVGNNRAWTCKVRVQNQSTCRNVKERRSITVPCDVWRMDSGGFAWRLDVKAALSLGW